MPYDLPTQIMSSCTDGFMVCWAHWARDVTSGWFWTAMLLGFLVVLFMATQRFGTTRSYGFAAVTGGLGATIFAIPALALIDWYTASVFIINAVVGFIVLVLNER